MTTAKQRTRQMHRAGDGRYTKVNPCFRCSKSAGEDFWTEDRAANTPSNATLVLCKPCYDHLAALPDDTFAADISHAQYGKLPQGKAPRT